MEKIKISRSFLSGGINSRNEKRGIMRYNKMVDDYNSDIKLIESSKASSIKSISSISINTKSESSKKKPQLRRNKRGLIF